MSRNGSGTYNLPQSPFVSGTVISSTAVNSDLSDIANALTASIANDGQTPILANLPMSNYRHTGVGNAVARTDYAAAGQVQDGAFIWCGTAGGTANALTLTPTPAITAYAAGQVFRFKAGASGNSGAATVAISGLTAQTIQKAGSALVSGDIAANQWYQILYDGTNFQLSAWASGALSPSGISFAATQRVLGRNTAGAGAGEEVTFSQFLDWVGSAAQGDILYRGAASWARLAAGTSGNYLKTQGAGANPTWAAVSTGFTVATKQATTSGTAFDFTGIPSTTKLIMVLFNGVSLSGTDNLLVQIGPSGGFETTSYTSASGDVTNNVSSTSGFIIRQSNAANAWSGIMFIALMEASSNTWIANLGGATNLATGGGTKALAGTLDRVRLTRTGTDTFDAGSVTVSYI